MKWADTFSDTVAGPESVHTNLNHILKKPASYSTNPHVNCIIWVTISPTKHKALYQLSTYIQCHRDGLCMFNPLARCWFTDILCMLLLACPPRSRSTIFNSVKPRLAAQSLQNHIHTPRHLSMAPRLGRLSPPWGRQATFLLDDSSDKRLVQLHDRLPQGSQSSRSEASSIEKRSSVGQLNTNAHTYMCLPYGHVTNGDLSAALVGEDRWVEWRLFHSSSH